MQLEHEEQASLPVKLQPSPGPVLGFIGRDRIGWFPELSILSDISHRLGQLGKYARIREHV